MRKRAGLEHDVGGHFKVLKDGISHLHSRIYVQRRLHSFTVVKPHRTVSETMQFCKHSGLLFGAC